MAANTAPIKWAQRSDSLYLTIALPDVSNETIDLTDTALVFKGTSGGKEYIVDIEFYKEVSASGSTYKVLPRSVQMHIQKKSVEEEDDDDDHKKIKEKDEFWPQLLKDKGKEKNQVAIDWDRYVDEDEANGGFDTSALAGGMDMGGMSGGMGGGMGGMDMEALMKQMGGMEGMGMGGMDGGDEDENDVDSDDDDDDDVLPELEEVK